jgi:2-methylcitrate dehydratase PrpD
MWAHYHTNSHPDSYHEAQVSLPYSVAVALTEGDAFLDQYQQFKKMLGGISDLMGKITILPDDGLPTTVACRVEISLPGGQNFISQMDYPKGSIQNPMTSEERQAKFAKLATRVLSREKVRELMHLVDSIEEIKDIREVARHLRF